MWLELGSPLPVVSSTVPAQKRELGLRLKLLFQMRFQYPVSITPVAQLSVLSWTVEESAPALLIRKSMHGPIPALEISRFSISTALGAPPEYIPSTAAVESSPVIMVEALPCPISRPLVPAWNCIPLARVRVNIPASQIVIGWSAELKGTFTPKVCGPLSPRASITQPSEGQAAMAALTFAPKSAPACKLASITVVPLPKPVEVPPVGVPQIGAPVVEIWFRNWPMVQVTDLIPPKVQAEGLGRSAPTKVRNRLEENTSEL